MNATERLEARLASRGSADRRRVLLIVNPYATAVSTRLRGMVLGALRSAYEVDAVDTKARDDATRISRDAVQAGYDAVIALGGDGTVNEAANGLVGSDTCLTCLPGGRANVYCRMLGIPTDLVDATEHLMGVADLWSPRRVDLGRVDQRYFMFSAGVGLDASVVEQVDANPQLKARLGEWYYTWQGLRTFARRYARRAPRMEVALGDQRATGATAIVQNADPYTYFGDRPVHVGAGATLSSGDLAGVVLLRTRVTDVPTIFWRMLSSRASLGDHPQVRPFAKLPALTVRSLDERPLPIQVDGDYIGDKPEAHFAVSPAALSVLA